MTEAARGAIAEKGGGLEFEPAGSGFLPNEVVYRLLVR